MPQAKHFPCTGSSSSVDPLVLLHGWGFDSSIWESVIPKLQEFVTVIVIDLPCFGSSELCSDNIETVSEYLLKKLPERFIVLGWSLGGMVATYLAIHFPRRISALITVGSNLKWVGEQEWPGADPDNFADFFENIALDSAASLKHFCGIVAKGDKQERQLTKILRKSISDSSTENFLMGLNLLNSIDTREGYKKSPIPGLHLFGEKDELISLAVEERFRQLNKNTHTQTFKSCSHAIFFSDSDAFIDAVTEFIIQAPYRLNKQKISQAFSQSAQSYDGAAELQRNIGDKLFAKISSGKYKTILDVGSGTGCYSQKLMGKFSQAQVISLDIAPGMLQESVKQERFMHGLCADAEFLPLADNSVGLVFSNLAIQWCQNIPLLFSEINRVLKPEGQAYISTFVEGTLCELEDAWQQADKHIHVNHFENVAFLAASIEKEGFSIFDREEQTIILQYDSVKPLVKELKAIGAHNINAGRGEGLMGKAKWQAFTQAYEKFRQGDKVPATYQALYLTLTK